MNQEEACCDQAICVDDNCEIEGIHAPHHVRGKKEKFPRSKRSPWLLPACEALDESIKRAVCKLDVASFKTIWNEVENDFGSLSPCEDSSDRRLHYRIAALVASGEIVRVDCGGRLFAYLKPSSKLRGDIEFLRETLMQLISYSI